MKLSEIVQNTSGFDEKFKLINSLLDRLAVDKNEFPRWSVLWHPGDRAKSEVAIPRGHDHHFDSYSENDPTYILSHLYTSKGKVKSKFKSSSVYMTFKKSWTFDWKALFDGMIPDDYTKILIDTTSPSVRIEIKDFNDMPNVRFDLEHCDIKSIAGLEKARSFQLTADGKTEIEPQGLLSLLKADLQYLIVEGTPTTDGEKALAIIAKHVESKNIADCQEELIDAGLEAYAKL